MQLVEWFLNLRLGYGQYNLYLYILQQELIVVF